MICERVNNYNGQSCITRIKLLLGLYTYQYLRLDMNFQSRQTKIFYECHNRIICFLFLMSNHSSILYNNTES